MLKKSAIALAVAAAVAAPVVAQAEPTVYGRIHERLEIDKDEDLSLANGGHRLGVKGDTTLDNGLKVDYRWELESGGEDLNGDGDSGAHGGSSVTGFVTRLSYASLNGGFGKVTVGRQGNPYADAYKADVFERNSGAFEAVSFRFADAVVYQSNDMGGFNFFAGLVADGQGVEEDDESFDDIDATTIGVNFKVAGLDFTVANQSRGDEGTGGTVSEFDLNEDGDTDDAGDATFGPEKFNATNVGVSWTSGPLYIAGNLESESETDFTRYDFAVTYAVTSNVTVGVNLEHFESEVEATLNDDSDTVDIEDEETKTLVGVYAGLGGGVNTYAEYATFDEADNNNLTLGLIVSF